MLYKYLYLHKLDSFIHRYILIYFRTYTYISSAYLSFDFLARGLQYRHR